MSFFGYPRRHHDHFDTVETSWLTWEDLGVREEEPKRFDDVNLRPVLHVCQIAWTGVDHLGDRGFEAWCSCGATESPCCLSETAVKGFVEKHERVPFDSSRLEEARTRMREEQARYLAALEEGEG